MAGEFIPEQVAREVMALHAEHAVEIVNCFLDDALLLGNRERAMLWWEVLVRIEAAEMKAGRKSSDTRH